MKDVDVKLIRGDRHGFLCVRDNDGGIRHLKIYDIECISVRFGTDGVEFLNAHYKDLPKAISVLRSRDCSCITDMFEFIRKGEYYTFREKYKDTDNQIAFSIQDEKDGLIDQVADWIEQNMEWIK